MPQVIVREPGHVALSVRIHDGFTVGRDEGNDLRLADQKASRRHVRFHVNGADVEIEDTGSTHGVLVNGERVERGALHDGDRIQVGSVLLTFASADDPLEVVHHRASDTIVPGDASRRLRLLYQASRAIGATDEPEEAIGAMLAGIVDVLGCERGVVGISGPRGVALRRVVRANEAVAAADREEIVVSRALVSSMLERREAIIARPGAARPATLVKQGILSAMGAPIQCGPRILGFVYVDDRRERAGFGPDDLELLIAMGHLTGAVIESAERYERAVVTAAALRAERPAEELVGESAPMQALKALIGKYAPSGSSVLVQGESGTGKELVARALHQASPRADRPFVTLNCAAVPDTMIESELFGHTKGAFTGAVRASRGKFALADGGTLFLDEVGDLSAAAQAKLLRAIERGEIQPLGADAVTNVDVRIVAATHKDLREEVAEKRFREDLFYRLQVLEIDVPPLRDRAEDIPRIAEALLRAASRRMARRIDGFTPRALAALARHRWPGNVRELANEIERAAIAADGAIIDVVSLSPRLARSADAPRAIAGAPAAARSTMTLAERFAELEPLEKQLVGEALSAAGGNVSKAARLLGITRIKMTRRLKRSE